MNINVNRLPEDYWMGLGSELIGLDALQENARQAMTYRAITFEIAGRGYDGVFDIGCNVGALQRFITEFGKRLWIKYKGIDSNPYAILFCKDKGLSVGLGSIRNLSAEPNHECVVVKDVLEHLENLEPARAAFRVAAKAVILSFFIPPTPGSESIHQTEHGYYHNRYDENDLLEIATSNGFALEKRIDTWETDGNMNRTYVFLRKP